MTSFSATAGNVPYFFRTLAHRPEIFRTATAHMEAVLKTGTLPTKLKELVVVRTSQLNCTAYCLASHTAISLKLRLVTRSISKPCGQVLARFPTLQRRRKS